MLNIHTYEGSYLGNGKSSNAFTSSSQANTLFAALLNHFIFAVIFRTRARKSWILKNYFNTRITEEFLSNLICITIRKILFFIMLILILDKIWFLLLSITYTVIFTINLYFFILNDFLIGKLTMGVSFCWIYMNTRNVSKMTYFVLNDEPVVSKWIMMILLSCDTHFMAIGAIHIASAWYF